LASKLDINDLASSDYKFRFYSPHSITSHFFLIDQLTGHVKTQRSLDREYLCENKVCGPCTANNNCSLPVEIIVATQSANKQQKFVSFDVIIEDKVKKLQINPF
jgi:aminopeptidase-like protein